METHYTGSRDISEVIIEGIMSGEVVLATGLGEFRFRVIGNEANIISGRTNDHELITVDTNPPYRVIVSEPTP